MKSTPPELVAESMPSLTREEKNRLDSLSSYDYSTYYSTDPRVKPQLDGLHCLLFKGKKILERELHRLMDFTERDEISEKQMFNVFLKLGHITLLAQDFAKALSAYQKALQARPDDFWTDPGAYFGLGLVYLHFRAFKPAAEAFLRSLYSYPNSSVVAEIHARLGVIYKATEHYRQALKHFTSALNDEREPTFLTKTQIRFNIALCYDSAGDLDKAYEEYRGLLAQNDPVQLDQIPLQAAVNRQIGWLCYRHETPETTAEARRAKLQEAIEYLERAKNLEPNCGKTYYYLGRCHGEITSRDGDQQQQQRQAHEAFLNYRHSIDKSEADADTWCSIGVLYQQQSQPMDALQAFICAVELDPEHSAAWTNLGCLYEVHNQYQDALHCFRKAVKHKPTATAAEALKARIQVLEKELNSQHLINSQSKKPPENSKSTLPDLEEAWNQPIPSELRQRQSEFLKVKQNHYREGSSIFKMAELGAPSLKTVPLDAEQLNMLKVLRANRTQLNTREREILDDYEKRQSLFISQRPNEDEMLSHHRTSTLPIIYPEDDDYMKDMIPTITEMKPSMENQENNDSKIFKKPHKMLGELPHTFSLMAPLNVPLDISSTEVLQMATKRNKMEDFKPIFAERINPPSRPGPPSAGASPEDFKGTIHPLLRPTPLVMTETRKEAYAIELQNFCYAHPIAMVRGLTSALKMDLSLFSTKTLLETAPAQEVELRMQLKMPGDLNLDHLGAPTWVYDSQRTFTSIAHYSTYQAETFKHMIKEEAEKLRSAGAKYGGSSASTSSANGGTPTTSAPPSSLDGGPSSKKRKMETAPASEHGMPMKYIKFGTNVDLSDENKFKAQLHELAKMPPFCRLISGSNMLSHLGHTVLGMNTVQLYMKVPGSRTPGHQENNCLASININIGPGDCEWFAIPYEYWGVIDEMCQKFYTGKSPHMAFLDGSWWPNVDDLLAAGVPVYRFTQKAGDLVWVGSGCVHWVQATGWCNNIAWNVGPTTSTQLQMALQSYEWNRLYRYKSLVPMQHLCWQLAKNIKMTNQKFYSLVKGVLIRSLAYSKMVHDYCVNHKKVLKPQPRLPGEVSHYCAECEVEVFNILLVKDFGQKFRVYCIDCARRAKFSEFIVLQQYEFGELQRVFDNCQLHSIPKTQLIC